MARDYRDEQRHWDYRFFRVVHPVLAVFGEKNIKPGDVFPSLRGLQHGEREEEDPRVTFQHFRRVLEAASGGRKLVK